MEKNMHYLNDVVKNKKNETGIEWFTIIGLFGHSDITLNFIKETNIYLGENGLGKTTILNCFYYVLCNDYERLLTMPFSEIRIKFKGETEAAITKMDVSKYVNKNSRRFRYSYREDEVAAYIDACLQNFGVKDINLLDTELRNEIVRRTSRMFDVSVSYVNSIMISYYINRDYKKGDEKNVTRVISLVKSQISERVIYLTTYRRIEKDYSGYFTHDSRMNRSDDNLIRFGMKDVDDAINNVLETIRTATNQGFNKMTGILLEKYTNINKQVNCYKTSNYDKLDIVLSRLGKQIDEENKNRILNMVNDKSIFDEKYKYLLDLIDELVNSYNSLEKYDEKINKFTDTCNKYLNNKQFIYNPSEISLKITSSTNIEDKIDLSMLSSGEKQIVSLFSRLYLESENKCILLIDEPELSISMKWQKMLLPDIMRSQNCSLLLTVTHSPFIFDNEFDFDAQDIWYCFKTED